MLIPKVIGDVVGFVGSARPDGADDGDAGEVDPVLGQGPDEVNLPTSGHRRVPGLRREEVALLVGVTSWLRTP
ncbi:hypothetical protein OG874_08455 [Nocardia sp. NBC_00565]|uniref:hypothetical protein n=1 Tax=Nocardia sp. NBC_00565 TaxID=2975993 RepID=UPI002E821397|nr:hypothetical protein [Nocardia sp. NBC_00565]WUC08359.1 hypothetical protein OG874_08455 [Nocardia sp. NBC_00565]